MIILIGSPKGGCGKSTTAVNISAELSTRGHDVVLVDADKQATGANWVGLVLGRDYPWPVVRRDEARARTLARYAVVKAAAAGPKTAR